MNQRTQLDPSDSIFEPRQPVNIPPLADALLRLDRSGHVQSAEGDGALGDLSGWQDQDIAAIVDRLDRDCIGDILAATETPTSLRIIGMKFPTGRVRPVAVSAVAAKEEDAVEVHLQDARPMADLQARLAQAQSTLNEEIRTDQAVTARYRALLAHLSEPVVLIDSVSGRILDLSEAAATILGGATSAFVGGAFTQCFEGRRRSEFLDALMVLGMSGSGASVTMELRSDGRAINLSASIAGSGADTIVLCTLHDPDHSTAPAPSRDLTDAVADGVVELSADMLIGRANSAFTKLVGATTPVQITGRPFAQFLARGAIDLRALTDPTDRNVLTTQIQTLIGQRTPVEISSAPLPAGGHVLVLRGTTLIELSRGTQSSEAEGGINGVPDATGRVGTETLRDIVASMTDVLEKQCIEEALSLTRNNRVATAEMLGLSRQSLYVKLRRFGLLNTGES